MFRRQYAFQNIWTWINFIHPTNMKWTLYYIPDGILGNADTAVKRTDTNLFLWEKILVIPSLLYKAFKNLHKC